MTRRDMREAIYIRTAAGPVAVLAHVVDGLAVHPWLTRNGTSDDKYAVSNVSTGDRLNAEPMGIKRAARLRDAVANVIDWTAPAGEVYRQFVAQRAELHRIVAEVESGAASREARPPARVTDGPDGAMR